MKRITSFTAIALLLTALSGCLTQRTVTENGRTVSQEYKVKRPIKEALAE